MAMHGLLQALQSVLQQEEYSFLQQQQQGGVVNERIEVACRDLLTKNFLQASSLPMDDLIFFVPMQRLGTDKLIIRRKVPLSGNSEQQEDTILKMSSIEWLPTLALNIICQLNYSLKISLVKDCPQASPPDLMQYKKVFAAPNKAYFSGFSGEEEKEGIVSAAGADEALGGMSMKFLREQMKTFLANFPFPHYSESQHTKREHAEIT
jgi:Uncharacterized conserved protein (DUF2045)